MKITFELLTSFMAVGSALGANIPARAPIAIPDHGDGFYAVLADRNVPYDYSFTHIDDVKFTKRTASDFSPREVAIPALTKRQGVSCEGGDLDRTDLINAELCLIASAGGAAWSQWAWGWCKVNSVVAYVCNYQVQSVTGATVNSFFDAVSATCGGVGGGFYRCTNACGVNDYAVGRKANGLDFCASGFTG